MAGCCYSTDGGGGEACTGESIAMNSWLLLQYRWTDWGGRWMGGHVQVRVCCDEWLAVVAVLMGGCCYSTDGGGGEACTGESIAMNSWLLLQC